jgi:spore maturation protein CgeB
MRIAFYGSSLLSAYWNGAATYYRGLLQALAAHGHDITFYEPDAFDRQSHRDIDPPAWCKVRIYQPSIQAMQDAAAEAATADVVIKASGVGIFDDEILEATLAAARPGALRIFWDVDAPATLATLQASPDAPLRRRLHDLDFVLTYGGGPPVIAAYRALGVQNCIPIYNALDPATHFPVPPNAAYTADLAFLGNRLPDRESRVEHFLLAPALKLPNATFILGGSGWHDKSLPPNVRALGHVPTAAHNVFNSSPRAILNIARDNMAEIGFSPATRLFEVAGASACLITDSWQGIENFLSPNSEVLVARDGADVAEHLSTLTPERARAIGQAARARCLAEHTYQKRAAQVHAILSDATARRFAA